MYYDICSIAQSDDFCIFATFDVYAHCILGELRMSMPIAFWVNERLENNKGQHCAKGLNYIILDNWHNNVIFKMSIN